jgi:WS/DGAT/MGAT family acyltransferase
MEQLGALDNLMVAGEMPSLPMHISAMMIYRTRDEAGADELYRLLLDRMDEVTRNHFPILRCRADRLPLEMDRAYWVEAPDFSLSYHLKRVSLGGEQGWTALHRLLGDFHARPLDMGRPLWQVLMVDGLDDVDGVPAGSCAIMFKIHHGALDGKGAIRLVRSLHSIRPNQPMLAQLEQADHAQHNFSPPSFLRKYARAWWHAIERPVDLVVTLVELLPGLLRPAGASHLPTPPSPFNRPVSPDRVTGHLRMSRRTLERLQCALGCTINDLALVTIGGALRILLGERNELPGDSLVALMPIDLRLPDQQGDIGNHVSAARVNLGTNFRTPRQRLGAIMQTTKESKAQAHGPSGHLMEDLVGEIHPALLIWLGEWLIQSGHMEDLPQTVNTVVTNVPGFQTEAYLGKARLLDYLGLGPLAPNMGLFHTVSSTANHVNITFVGTGNTVGDGSDYQMALKRAWAGVRRL